MVPGSIDDLPKGAWLGGPDPLRPIELPERPGALGHRVGPGDLFHSISACAELLDVEAELC